MSVDDAIRGTGDEGQRYEVRAKSRRHGWREITIGWTNAVDGGGIARMVAMTPDLSEMKIKDRCPEIEKLLTDWTKFKGRCRRCLEGLYAGKEACTYCNYRYPGLRAAERVN